MIISHEHKFIFFKPMKVAGSSIEVALSKICGDEDLQTGSEYQEEIEEFGYIPKNNELIYHSHTSPPLLYRRSAKKWEDYQKITVVRNPWDLIVSYYWWSFNSPASSRENVNKPLETVSHQLWTPHINDGNIEIQEKFQGYLEQMAFFRGTPYGNEGPERVIKWLADSTHEFYDASIDRIIRFENIQEDFDQFCQDLDIEAQVLPRLKSGQRKKTMHYRDYYDDYSSFLVKKEFRPLIDRFGYEF